MARQALTDRSLRALKLAPAGQRYDILDAVVPGLGVRVSEASKRFILVARFPPSRNPTRRTLGEYPALELAAARDRARDWLALVERGIDPAEQLEGEKQERAQAAAAKKDRSFETILDRYIKARRRDGVRKVDEDERDFNRECLPVWKGRDVADLSMADILKVVEAIRDRGAGRQALNMAQKIGTFFAWAEDDELIPASPYKPKRVRIAIGEKQARDRVLNDAEIAAFWKATETLDDVYRDVYRLLMLTGQRLNDIAQASWSEIDMEKATLTIPAKRFKSDRNHVIPLTSDVVSILQGVQHWRNCDWVFTLNGEGPVTVGDKVKKRLDAALLAALREGNEAATLPDFINHDLRRTVRTRLSELDVMDEISEAILGHAPPTLIKTYSQSDRLRAKLEALNRWQGELRRITGQAGGDNVVPMKGRA